MKTSYFVCAATAFAAVVGGVSAWPSQVPVREATQLVRAKPLADLSVRAEPPLLPPISMGPNDRVIPASASVPQIPPPPELPRVPPPPMPPSIPAAPPLPMTPPAIEVPKLPAVPPPTLPMPVAPSAPAPIAPPQKLPIVPPPATLPAPTPLVPPAAPGLGSVVLLTDGKMVEGTVTQTGEKVLVRRGSIDQPFAKDLVQFIGKSKDECYKHLLEKVKADDAPGKFKLARWCMYNGLREQALAEAQSVVKLQPNHAMAAEMARSLEESIRLFHADGTSKLPPPEAPKPAAPVAPKVVDVESDVPAEAVAAFGPRVQPVLANLCADCHAKPAYSGSFKLACGTGADHDAGIIRQNLKATIGQIKKTDPSASPLLEKALAAHGGMKQAAFANRMAPAFRVLEAWVILAAGPTGAPPAPVLPPPPETKPAPEAPKPVLPPVPPPPAVKFGEEAKPAPKPEPNGESMDEFDPTLFNRTRAAK